MRDIPHCLNPHSRSRKSGRIKLTLAFNSRLYGMLRYLAFLLNSSHQVNANDVSSNFTASSETGKPSPPRLLLLQPDLVRASLYRADGL